MDWIEELVKDPERSLLLGYSAFILGGSAYAAYRNDFGAQDKTRKELDDYLDEVETGLSSPLSTWKAHEYRKERDERNEERNEIDVQKELQEIYDDVQEPVAYSDD